MDESGDVVSLVLSIPDFIHSENINVEVVGGRMIHIQAEKTGPGSRKRFLDKRFALGEHLNESNLEAKLSKGKLVVSAPKDGTRESIIGEISQSKRNCDDSKCQGEQFSSSCGYIVT